MAIRLPAAIRDVLAAEVERLRPRARHVAWIAPDNLHLTLKFLGGVEAERLDAVAAVLAGVAAGAAPFTLAIRGLGAFPTPSRARVLWAGVADGAAPLAALAARVDEALVSLAFAPEEHAFSAHVTLGRARKPRRDAALAAALETAGGRDFGRFTVEGLTLMRSDLSPRGARYTPLATCRLAAGEPGGPPESPWRN